MTRRLAYLNDPAQRAEIAARGEDAEHLHLRYIKQVNAALAGRPAGLAVTTHLCRGNFRSSWAASGGYDFVAEALFGGLDVDGFFLEYDDERSGGFAPLRFVPPGKMVVLGLVTTKRGELEDPDVLKRRIDEASRFVPLDQLCPVRAVRVLLHRGGQRADLRPAGRQARTDRQRRPRHLGLRPEPRFGRSSVAGHRQPASFHVSGTGRCPFCPERPHRIREEIGVLMIGSGWAPSPGASQRAGGTAETHGAAGYGVRARRGGPRPVPGPRPGHRFGHRFGYRFRGAGSGRRFGRR